MNTHLMAEHVAAAAENASEGTLAEVVRTEFHKYVDPVAVRLTTTARRLSAVRKAYRELQRTYIVERTNHRWAGERVLELNKANERLIAEKAALQDRLNTTSDDGFNWHAFFAGVIIGILILAVYAGTVGV